MPWAPDSSKLTLPPKRPTISVYVYPTSLACTAHGGEGNKTRRPFLELFRTTHGTLRSPKLMLLQHHIACSYIVVFFAYPRGPP